MHERPYLEFLRFASRVTRRADEAQDLLQTVLLAAIEAGRADMTCANNRRWLFGALRKRAQFDARSAIRRRRRESSAAGDTVSAEHTAPVPSHFLSSLPPGLRTTALLALTGHSRAEIVWLLHLSDSALRQRIAAIKRRWRKAGGCNVTEFPGLSGGLPFGLIRRALLKSVRERAAYLASHDPDGNLFVLSSQNAMSRQRESTSTRIKE